MILLIPIILFVLVALLWKKGRTVLLAFAIVVASAEVYYLLYTQDTSVQEGYEDEAMLDTYLEEKYPDDDWVIRRQNASTFFSNGLEVIFIDELEVVYLFIIEDHEVIFAGYSMEEGYENPKRNQ